jgi:uncharacterized protein
MTLITVQPTLEDRLRMRARPDRSPLMYQSWRDLLFLHWRIDPDLVQRTLPAGLLVDTHDDVAYVGIVPFRVERARPRGIPALPGISNFLEMNVRTYVHDHHGNPGVLFYSLDCNQPLAVWGARAGFGLNYRHASMSFDRSTARDISFSSSVKETGRGCQVTCDVEPATHTAAPGTLEFYLVERYALFVQSGDRLYCGRVHHRPYPMQQATLRTSFSDLLGERGFQVNEAAPDDVRAATGVDVEVFALQAME